MYIGNNMMVIATRMNIAAIHLPASRKPRKPKLTFEQYCDLCATYGEFFPVECNGKFYMYHHAACAGGYVSRVKDAELSFEVYDGRFGRGYRLHLPRFDSTRYHTVVYYIER